MNTETPAPRSGKERGMSHTVVLGHSVRRWTHFEVGDLTDGEVSMLSEGGPKSVALLQRLEESGRAVFIYWHDEDQYDPFDGGADPDVVDVFPEVMDSSQRPRWHQLHHSPSPGSDDDRALRDADYYDNN